MVTPSVRGDPDRDLVEILLEGVVVLAVVVVASPILVVAAMLGTVIEERTWPRWPFLVGGGGATAAAVAAGAFGSDRSAGRLAEADGPDGPGPAR